MAEANCPIGTAPATTFAGGTPLPGRGREVSKHYEITHHDLPFLKALLDAAGLQLMQARAMLMNPMFRQGARLTIEELGPAYAWLQATIKGVTDTGAENTQEERKNNGTTDQH